MSFGEHDAPPRKQRVAELVAVRIKGDAYSEMIRFLVVGVMSNALLFLNFIALTEFGMEHKAAMTAIFSLGVAQTFLANKIWTFRHSGSTGSTFIRYALSYAMAYCINFGALYIYVDLFEYSYHLVQGVMIFVVAGLLFLLQRYWIFKTGLQRNL